MLTETMRLYVWAVNPSARLLLYFVAIYGLSFYSYSKSDQVHDHFFADIRNPFNQYFVKFSWGWTFSAVALMHLISLYRGHKTVSRIAKPVLRLVVGTVVWYVITQLLFLAVEEATGVCQNTAFLTKKHCKLQGYRWSGFDTSGHCFLLIWNSLFIIEESLAARPRTREKGKQAGGASPTDGSGQRNRVSDKASDGLANSKSGHGSPCCDKIDLLEKLCYVLLAGLLFIWELMLVTTSLYFHTFPEKALGTLLAGLMWLIVYKWLYTTVLR